MQHARTAKVLEQLPPQLRAEPPRDPRPLQHLWSVGPLLLPAAATVILPAAVLLMAKLQILRDHAVALALGLGAALVAATMTALAFRRLRQTRRVLVHGRIVAGKIVSVRAGHLDQLQARMSHNPAYTADDIEVAVTVGYVDPQGVARRGLIIYKTQRLGEIDDPGTLVPVLCDPHAPGGFVAFLPRHGLVFAHAPALAAATP